MNIFGTLSGRICASNSGKGASVWISVWTPWFRRGSSRTVSCFQYRLLGRASKAGNVDAVDGGGRVVDVKRKDCPAPINALDLDAPPTDHAAVESVPRDSPPKGGRPSTRTSDINACGTLIHIHKSVKHRRNFLKHRAYPKLDTPTHPSSRSHSPTSPFPTYAAVVKQAAFSSSSPSPAKGKRRTKGKPERAVAEGAGGR